jgi:hypothetical protein
MLPMLEIDERKTLARNVSASEKALNTVVESRLDVPAITRESLLELRRCRNPTPLMHSALEAVVLILGVKQQQQQQQQQQQEGGKSALDLSWGQIQAMMHERTFMRRIEEVGS